MWIFTKYGFFSAVCARGGDGGHSQPVDFDTIMVRARCREHLEALKIRFPFRLGACEIQTNIGTDYAFRLFVTKSSWSRVMAALAVETDFDNFKGAVARHEGVAGAPYVNSLHEVWDVMRELQPKQPKPLSMW